MSRLLPSFLTLMVDDQLMKDEHVATSVVSALWLNCAKCTRAQGSIQYWLKTTSVVYQLNNSGADV